jgi:hypothetical protein
MSLQDADRCRNYMPRPAASDDHKQQSPTGFPMGLLCCQVINEVTPYAEA